MGAYRTGLDVVRRAPGLTAVTVPYTLSALAIAGGFFLAVAWSVRIGNPIPALIALLAAWFGLVAVAVRHRAVALAGAMQVLRGQEATLASARALVQKRSGAVFDWSMRVALLRFIFVRGPAARIADVAVRAWHYFGLPAILDGADTHAARSIATRRLRRAGARATAGAAFTAVANVVFLVGVSVALFPLVDDQGIPQVDSPWIAWTAAWITATGAVMGRIIVAGEGYRAALYLHPEGRTSHGSIDRIASVGQPQERDTARAADPVKE